MTQPVPELPALDIHSLLKRFRLRPDRKLGQNFLIDQSALRKVIAAAEISPNEAVLEVGPGLGSLTRYLAVLSRLVVAVELDEHLLPALKQVVSPYPNVRIVQGDILKQDPSRLMRESQVQDAGYLVVANIPYYITSALLRHLLEASQQPRCLVLTVQREVAERLCAAPGDMSLLALSVQVYGQPEICCVIPAESFYPIPNVDSAVVKVAIKATPFFPPEQLNSFFLLAKAGFSQKRKTLRNALAGGMRWTPQTASQVLEAAEIDPQRRAETLNLQEWAKLVQAGDTLTSLTGGNP